MRTWIFLLALAFVAPMVLTAPDAVAATKKKSKKKVSKKKTKKRAKKKKATKKKRGKIEETIPIDIGIGPAMHLITGPIEDDQAQHYGLKVSLKAIIDRAMIQRHKGKIPKKYRKYTKGVNEVRYGPSIFIPDTLFISPKTERTGLYGINFRPIAVGFTLIQKPRLAVDIGLDFTYMLVDSDRDGVNTQRLEEYQPAEPEGFAMHFLRPGLDLQASFELPIAKSFLIELGWQSTFYPPQEVGGPIFELGEIDDSIWHIGQAFLKFHFRIPYKVKI